MHISKDFKLWDRNKIIMRSVIGVGFIAGVVLLIVTVWWKNDLAMTEALGKGMDYNFIRGWTGGSVIDGYIVIISYSVPLAFVVVESIYAHFKKRRKFSFKPWNPISLKVIYVIGLTLYVLGIAYELYLQAFDDEGFGYGFTYKWMIGWSYLIPIYIVSFIINCVTCFALTWYVHAVVAKRKDFLSSGYWKRAFIAGVFVAFLYIPNHFIKDGMGRPYLYNIYWADHLDKIKAIDPSRYENYIHQGAVNYGWQVSGWNTPNAQGIYNNGLNYEPGYREFPWWKMAKNEFDKNIPGWEHFPKGDGFPSGHMCEFSIVIAMTYALFGNPRNKKEENLQLIMFMWNIFILLNAFFALGVSITHWISDMAFVFIWAPIGYILDNWLMNWLFKPDHSIWVKRIAYKLNLNWLK